MNSIGFNLFFFLRFSAFFFSTNIWGIFSTVMKFIDFMEKVNSLVLLSFITREKTILGEIMLREFNLYSF